MSITFGALAPGYDSLLVGMEITRPQEVDATARKLIRLIDAGHYVDAYKATGVPQIVAAASFEREASSNFRLSPAQGDPWNEVSRHVPRGVGPFPSWEAAAIWSYRHDGLDRVGVANWSWSRACFEEELFNGFGYRAKGIHSPYLWAGSNRYHSGKYVADGVFSYSAVDSQLGVIPMMARMVQLRPDLALPIPYPGSADPHADPHDAPKYLTHGVDDLQTALNKLGADPQLDVDGNYGRHTKVAVMAFQKAHGLDADGIAGPLTWDAINKAMQ